MMNDDQDFEIGTTYLFSLPPSWIIGGTVKRVGRTRVFLKDPCYLETLSGDRALISDPAYATTAKQLLESCSASWPLPDGTSLLAEAIEIAVPCARDLLPLARRREAAAIRGAS